MEKFRAWIFSENVWIELNKTLGELQVQRITQELQTNPIGVAWTGIYNCNYGFLAQVQNLNENVNNITGSNLSKSLLHFLFSRFLWSASPSLLFTMEAKRETWLLFHSKAASL